MDTLEDRTAEPIRRIETLARRSITRQGDGRHVVDFGQNLFGWLRLKVAGEAGREIPLRHAELLIPDGELETPTCAARRRPTGTFLPVMGSRNGNLASPSTGSGTPR